MSFSRTSNFSPVLCSTKCRRRKGKRRRAIEQVIFAVKSTSKRRKPVSQRYFFIYELFAGVKKGRRKR